MSHARKRKSARRGRSLRMESLERRNLLAGDGFHNFLDPADVNNDDAVTALDALTIVNRLNRSEASGEEVGSLSDRYWDVNDDGHASAVDALMVINQLSRDSAGAGGELEAKLSGDASERVKVKFEHAGQGRKLEVKIQNALPSSTFDVSVEGESLGSVATDANGRGRIELREFDSVGRPLPSIVAGNAVTISEIGTSVFGGKGESDDHDGSHDVSGVGDSDHDINDVDGNGVGDSNDGLNDVAVNAVSSRSVAPAPVEAPEAATLREPAAEPIAEPEAMADTSAEHESISSAEPERLSLRTMLLATGTPNTTYSLTIDGVSLGEVTTDATGSLSAELTPVVVTRTPAPVVSDDLRSDSSDFDTQIGDDTGMDDLGIEEYGIDDSVVNDFIHNDSEAFSDSNDGSPGHLDQNESSNDSVDDVFGDIGNYQYDTNDVIDDVFDGNSLDDVGHGSLESHDSHDDSFDEIEHVRSETDFDSSSDDSSSEIADDFDESQSSHIDIIAHLDDSSNESVADVDDSVHGSVRPLSNDSQGTSSQTDSSSDNDHGTFDNDDSHTNEVNSIDSRNDDDGIESINDDHPNDGVNELFDENHQNENHYSDDHDLSENNDSDDFVSVPVVPPTVVSPAVTPVVVEAVTPPVIPVTPFVPLTPVVAPQQYGKWSGSLSGAGYGKVEFERERGESEFEVEIRNVAANATHPVSVGGVVVGQIRTDSRGRGKLKFEVGDDQYRTFPANFPKITDGVSVQAGDILSGVFGQYFGHDDDDDHDERDHDDHDD